MNRLAKWFFTTQPRTTPKIGDIAAFVERNTHGGWSIRTSDDPAPLGNYPSAARAEEIARLNFDDVRVIDETLSPSAA
jgi:hypothetical protein